jgi:hypothetical protein
MDQPRTSPRRLARAAAGFVALGMLLYFALYAGAEWLLREQADANPFHRIAVAQRQVDWVILGSSHAMPLGFGGLQQQMERDTGLVLLNLGTQGAGPLYNRLVLEQLLRTHEVRHVLCVVDAFAFDSRAWNEDRIAEPKLLARTPWDPALAGALASYVRDQDVSWRAWLAYVSGFPKINNRERFQPDRWEGEAQFDRTWRASKTAVRKRMEYLYPDGVQPPVQARYLAQLDALLRQARSAGATAVVVKLPVPRVYREALPDEAGFDAALERSALLAGASVLDLSRSFDAPEFFFDSDHLNRRGVTALYRQHLRALLAGAPAAPLVDARREE